jgi:hypothetical protein
MERTWQHPNYEFWPMIRCTLSKQRRFNPHYSWAIFCSVLIVALTALLILSSWFFVETTGELDAPRPPVLESNAVKIQEMQQAVGIVERAVEKRIAK